MNNNRYFRLAGLSAALGLSACTAGQTGPPTVTPVNPTVNGNSALSLAVGTANIAGHAGLSLNVVPLYRQKNGASAVLVDTPKLTGPFVLPAKAVPNSAAPAQYDANSTAEVGPTAVEIAGKFIEGSPQSGQIGVPSAVNSTFGTNGGVFGNGFAPANYGTSGGPASGIYSPYFQPFYAGFNVSSGAVVTTSPLTGTTPTSLPSTFIQTASAPAFDPAGNGQGPTGPNFPNNGLSLGLNVFEGVVPGAGAYTLSVSIPTTGGGALTPTPATASLTNPGLTLPIATTGGAPAVTFNGDGSVAVTNVALPAPIVGAYVELIDYGPLDTTTGSTVAGCNGATVGAPVYYTHWVTASGTVTFANANAPYGQTTAVCTAAENASALDSATVTDVFTGDAIQVVVIAFDYNEYGLQYNGRTGATYPQSPTLPAQADSSISLSTYVTSP